MIKKISKTLFLLLFSVIFLVACNTQKENTTPEKPIVYTSFFPIYDLVKQVSKDTVEVRVFMPMNVDPHLWEPTAKDMRELTKADVLFINGANMEKWAEKVEENVPNIRIINLSEKINLISYKGAADLGDFQYMTKINAKRGTKYKFEFGHTHEDVMRVCFVRNEENLSEEELIAKAKENMKEKGKLVPQKETINVEENKVYSLEMGHQSGRIFFEFDKGGDWYVVSDRISEKILSYKLMQDDEELKTDDLLKGSTSSADKITYDPHSWLSINNAKAYITRISDVLSETYPENSKIYKKSSLMALDKLTKIHAKYSQKFKELDNDKKEFVVTHYAWEYLAQEFGLIQFPLQGLISTESPSLKTIRKAISFCKQRDIDTIFYETNTHPKSAQTLSEEIGGKVQDLTSMEYIQNIEGYEVGSYNIIMEQNIEKLYNSMKGKGQ